jgi:uncharacterized protein (TIGR00295 family)
LCTVTVLAKAIAIRSKADLELVTAGALLHDIGRTRTHGLRHGMEGAQIARSIHLPESVVLIIQKHVGAGITPQEAEGLGLPPLDYMPSTLEEMIVCHADNLVGDATYLTSSESYEDFKRKGLEQSGKRMLAMHRELSERCGEDVDDIVREVKNTKVEGPCSKHLKMKMTKWMD